MALLLRHALPISLLILRKRPTVLQSICKPSYGRRSLTVSLGEDSCWCLKNSKTDNRFEPLSFNHFNFHSVFTKCRAHKWNNKYFSTYASWTEIVYVNILLIKMLILFTRKELKLFHWYQGHERRIFCHKTQQKKCLTDYVPLKTTRRVFLPTYKIHSFQISTLKLNFQAFAAKRGNYVWWTKTVFCLICFREDKKKIMLFLGQKYDHPRLQYFKLKLESSGNDSILRAEASFSWSSSQDTVSFLN